MRVRDAIKMAKALGLNVLNSVVFTFTEEGTPAVTFKAKEILNLHEGSIALSKLVTNGFNKRRILWEDLRHELKFVDPKQRTDVCLTSLKEMEKALQELLDETSGSSGSDLKLVDMILALMSIVKDAGDKFRQVPDIDAYNDWVRSIGGGSDEFTDANEQLEDYFEVIVAFRKRTYPIWQSLIDLLPDGMVQSEAERQFAAGLKTVNLDSAEVESQWEMATV